MGKPDKQLTFTEQDFKSALFDAFIEGRVCGISEAGKSGAISSWDWFEQMYSGDKQVWCSTVAKIRNQFNAEGKG